VRRVARLGVGLLLVVGLGLGLGYVTRAYTLHPLIVRLAPWVAARIGPYELAVEELRGDWFTRLEVRGLALREVGDNPVLRTCKAERVEVVGGLRRLVFGDLSRLERVRLERVELELDLTADSDAPTSEGAPFPLPARLAFPALEIVDSRCRLLTGRGAIDFDSIECEDTTSSDGVPGSSLTCVVTHADARAELVASLLRGQEQDTLNLTVMFHASELAVAGGSATLDARADLSATGLRARGTFGVADAGEVRWTGMLSAPANDASRIARGLVHVPLALHLEGELASLDVLVALVPELRRATGRVTLEADVVGSIAAPEPTGRVLISRGSVRVEGVAALDEIEIELALSPAQVEIVEASCNLGAAPVDAHGVMKLTPEGPVLELRITGDNVLLARSSELRLRADVDVHLDGPLATPSLTGEIALVGSRVRLDLDLLGALQGALPGKGKAGKRAKGSGAIDIPGFGPEAARVDLALLTREPVRVQGNVARGALRSDLRLTGSAAAPVLIGQVFVDPLELALPAATVRYESGVVRFDAARPNVPLLELVGETRVAGYDVQVALEGPYDQPEVRLTSSPPLSADQLLLLVVSGRPPAEAGQISAAGESLAVYIAKDLVRSWFDDGGFDEGRSFLSRIEIVTGRDVSKSGVLTLEATYQLREKLGTFDGGVFAVVARDAFEDYNLGLRFVVKLR